MRLITVGLLLLLGVIIGSWLYSDHTATELAVLAFRARLDQALVEQHSDQIRLQYLQKRCQKLQLLREAVPESDREQLELELKLLLQKLRLDELAIAAAEAELTVVMTAQNTHGWQRLWLWLRLNGR